jgi:hypothetical protein
MKISYLWLPSVLFRSRQYHARRGDNHSTFAGVPVNVLFLNHLLSQRIVGTVIAKASVETSLARGASLSAEKCKDYDEDVLPRDHYERFPDME